MLVGETVIIDVHIQCICITYCTCVSHISFALHRAQKEAENDKGNGAAGGDTPPEYEPEGNGGGGEDPSTAAGGDEGDDDVIETTDPVPKIPEPPDRPEITTKSNKKQDHQNVRRQEQNRANKVTELRDENQPPPNNRASSVSSENHSKSDRSEGSGSRPIKKSRSRAGSERSSSGNISSSKQGSGSQLDSVVPSCSPRKGKREEGWKEVGRR